MKPRLSFCSVAQDNWCVIEPLSHFHTIKTTKMCDTFRLAKCLSLGIKWKFLFKRLVFMAWDRVGTGRLREFMKKTDKMCLKNLVNHSWFPKLLLKWTPLVGRPEIRCYAPLNVFSKNMFTRPYLLKVFSIKNCILTSSWWVRWRHQVT